MRFRPILTAALGGALLAGSVVAAAPAHATGPTADVRSDVVTQYGVSCTTASTCNTVTTSTLHIAFERTGSTASSLGIFYKVVDVNAVNGTDYSTPATGEEIIPAGQTSVKLAIPTLEGGVWGTFKTFSVEITGTTVPITITNGTATGGMNSGNVPTDCSFTFEGGLSLALTCTGRPATQMWHLRVSYGDFHATNGSEVTGEGTSTANAGATIEAGLFAIDS
jgi:hypothetical protein